MILADIPTGTMRMACIRTSTRTLPSYTCCEGIMSIGFIINNTVEDENNEDDPAEKLWHIVKYYRNSDTLDGYGIKLK